MVGCRFLRVSQLRGGGGQEAVLPHVGGDGQGEAVPGRHGGVRLGHKQSQQEVVRLRGHQSQVSNVSLSIQSLFIVINIQNHSMMSILD